MRLRSALAPVLVASALLGACATNPKPAAPAPQPRAAAPQPAAAPDPATAPAPAAPDLAGEWEFTSTIGEETVGGTLTLTRSGQSYTGLARAHDGQTFPLRSLTLVGGKVVMTFDTPDGVARVESTLTGVSAMSGTVLVGDAVGTFAARRQ